MPDAQGRWDLTKNQSLVLGALSGTSEPMTAYELLDRLRSDGLRAPLQVYRALEKLQEFGLVHRLESLNAFVACSHPGTDVHEPAAFAICDACSKIIEFADPAVADDLERWADSEGFKTTKTTIEIRGVCRSCGAA